MAKNMTVQVPPSPTGIYTVTVGTGGGGGTFSDVGGSGILAAGVGGGIVNNGGGLPLPLSPMPYQYDDSVLNHFIKDHEIQGQTIMAEYILPPNYLGMNESEIKKLLVEKLVQEMYKVNNQHNIEFTQMKKVDTDEMVYRARIHVVPDTQVRIIRELKNAKKKV